MIEKSIQTNLGRWSRAEIERLLEDLGSVDDPGACVALLSERFRDLPYRTGTLVGGREETERLVIDLAGVDCFTFLDYVEALRRSTGFDGFVANLQRVRYRDGNISFATRNHFFSDWIEASSDFLRDITGDLAGMEVMSVRKMLNERGDGRPWVDGIPFRPRTIRYVPAAAVTDGLMGRLRTGDYLGVYSEEPGLDVSHVGIVVAQDNDVFLRHASSAPAVMKVVDQSLVEYLSGKPGLVVLRPCNPAAENPRT